MRTTEHPSSESALAAEVKGSANPLTAGQDGY